MKLTEYQPDPKLVTKTTQIFKPKFPVIDAHNHTGDEFGGGWCHRDVREFNDVLDAAGVAVFVDLDGGWGETILQQRLDKFKSVIPDRYAVFGGVEWEAWPDHGDQFGEWAAKQLRKHLTWGAQGLKIWKNLGLHVRDQHNNLVTVDDPRLIPLWETAGELNIPVLIHVADPVAFFDPIDQHNERFEELHAHPDWHFPNPPFPVFSNIMDQFSNLIKRHPNTIFVGAHVGCYAENLPWVSQLMDECPNLYVDIAERIAELGRQPYSARRFIINHADRVLFGTDQPANAELYKLHYRFLETDDEYFDYDLFTTPHQGRWRIYGLYFPDDVLNKIYYLNAQRVLNLR